MTKLSGNGYKAGSGGDQDGGHAVPEAVRVDMRKPPPLGELIQPCRDAGGIHEPSVVLSEQIPGILPAVPIGKTERRLGRSVFSQQRHRLRRDIDKADIPGFRGSLVNPRFFGVAEICANLKPSILQVHLRPFQTGHLWPVRRSSLVAPDMIIIEY